MRDAVLSRASAQRHFHFGGRGRRLPAAKPHRRRSSRRHGASRSSSTLMQNPDILAEVAGAAEAAVPGRFRRGDRERGGIRARQARAQAARPDRRQRCRRRAAASTASDNALLLLWPDGTRACSRAPTSASWRERCSRASPSACARTRHGARLSPCTKIELKILDPRLGGEFPLPDYATRGFGGHGPARDARCAADARSRRERADPERHRDPYRRSRAMRGDPAALGAWPQARHRARQPGRADRCRLPGAADDFVLESFGERLYHRAGGAHRAAGVRCRSCARRFDVVEEFAPSERGEGGFGSSGRH